MVDLKYCWHTNSKEFIKFLTIVSYMHIKYANTVSRHFLENYST